MMNIFDTHAHYDDSKFDEDRISLLSSFPDKGVKNIINCGTDLKTSEFTIELTKQFDYVYGAVGIHPEEADKADISDISKIKEMAKNDKIVAIGEIGLDYYWDEVPKEIQLPFFEEQIKLANSLDLPIIVHDREAHGDTMDLLKKHKPKGVLHCFSGSPEMAKEVLKLGMYIGIGGAVTFKNAKKPIEVVKMLPLDRLLLETDCPYMAPVPFRGKRNDSSLIIYVAEKIAEIKDVSVSEVLNATEKNAKDLFRIK